MTNIRLALLLGLLVSVAFEAGEAIAVVKCVDASGHVTYQEGECPEKSKGAPLESEAEKSPKSLLEEIVCGALWMREEPEFELEIGMVSNKDQIIMNGEKMDMPALFQTPAHSNFNFHRCGKYNYKRPADMRQMSINRWTSWQAICKMKDPAIFDSLIEKVNRQTGKMVITREDFGECDSLAKEFPTAAALEKHLRTTHHPLPGERSKFDENARPANVQRAPPPEPTPAPVPRAVPRQGASTGAPVNGATSKENPGNAADLH